mmetsp:Transcript_10035/g.28520  ORF Transcript_10035/g.28520 Transcript_10035/m.28520 type:complete len:406 (+) Transcript_10035:492-1709(+)
MSGHLFLVVVGNVKDRIRNTAIFCFRDIEKVRSVIFFFQHDILKECIRLDGMINIGFCALLQVDGLGVASTLKVVNSIFIPSVFIVTDQCSMRICGQRGFARTTQTKEQRNVAVLADVGGTVHGELRRIAHWQPVIHQREDSLLVLAAVPGTENHRLLFFDVEDDGRIGIQAMAFPLIFNLRAAVDDGEIRLEVVQVVAVFGSDEHVGDEMLLPCHFVHEPDLLARGRVGAAVPVEHVGRLASVEVSHGLVVQILEDFWRRRLVDIIPVDVGFGFGSLVQYDELVLGRTAGEFAGVHRERIAVLCLGDDAFLVLLFVLVQLLVRQVAVQRRDSGNPELVQSDFHAGIRAFDSARDVVRIAAFGFLAGRSMSMVICSGAPPMHAAAVDQFGWSPNGSGRLEVINTT